MIKLKCKKCGEVLDEDEIIEATVSSLDNAIILTVYCWNHSSSRETEIPIPDFLELVELEDDF
ncbi:MAG: hypothetical protein DRP57_13315 [Spirochaetes bacterium]|nr:MAG: hypothetical protein DRP57_13315 [Spirochaetota bacterium]